MNKLILILFSLSFSLLANEIEPTNAKESKNKKTHSSLELSQQFMVWKSKLSPEQQEWETILEQQLGSFYLPHYQRAKIANKPTAWDFVQDEPHLPRVLLIGDSVSRGYTISTRAALKNIANLHRAPKNCGPTSTGIKNMDIWLGKKKWDIIHFNFGIHDRRTPLETYRERLITIIERLKQTNAKLIWANTTPLPEVWKADKGVTPQEIIDRNKVAKEVMESFSIPINDLYNSILPHQNDFQNPNDCHFNGKGYNFLGNQVAKVIKDTLDKMNN